MTPRPRGNPTRSDRNYGTDPGDPARATIGGVGELSADAVSSFVSAALAEADLDGARVCLVVPDGTRTCPLPLLLQGARSPGRPGQAGDGGHRPRHASGHE